MKLIDQIRRQPAFVSFGRSSQDSGFVNVELAAVPSANSVTVTAADGSAAPIMAADGINAGVMSAADKVKLDGLNLTDLPSRSALVTSAIAPAVTHIRTAGYHTAGDGGGAVYQRVASEPTHALKVQSADLAWWQLTPDSHGYINVRQAGAVGDNTANDGQAFIDALSFAALNASSIEQATVGVIVPPGNFYLGANTLELKASVHLAGQGSGMSGGKPTRLRWDANTTGIIVHRYNTIGATTEADPAQSGADGSRIEGLLLSSGGGTIAGITDSTKGHGIWLRARAALRDLHIQDFPGCGVYIVAQAGGAANFEGNANNWVIDTLRVIRCHQSGIYLDGPDVNAGMAMGVDASSNGRWGIWDSSFLGNTYIGCHTATNGVATVGENGSGSSSIVHYNGPENGNTDRRYTANANATEAQLVGTTPGTSESVWIDIGAGAAHPYYPTWLAAQPTGTYFAGGSYRTDNANGYSTFVGCYGEGGQAMPQLAAPTNFVGGVVGSAIGGATGLVGNKLLGPLHSQNHNSHASSRDLTLSINDRADDLLVMYAEGDHPSGLSLAGWDDGGKHYILAEHANSASRRPIQITSNLSPYGYGRSAPIPAGSLVLLSGAWIGNGVGQARWFGGFRGKPTSGDFARGDLMLNYTPIAPGDPAGWRVTTAGTIGSGAVLEEFFSIPDLPANRGKHVRPHVSNNRIEWRDAPKAGTTSIADTASTQTVSFSTAFASANYAVALTADGDERVWVTAKTAAGFTLNRAASVGVRSVDWTAVPHEDL